MTDSVINRVRQIIADIFNVSLEEITNETSSDTIVNWDSLQHLNLVLAVEQSFGLQFTPEEIEKMVIVESIVKLVHDKT